MANIFSRIKEKFSGKFGQDVDMDQPMEEYVEVGPETKDDNKAKIVVRPFVMEDFDDIKPVLDALREGYTIALINIRPLKDKDLVELKRAINKLKKTTDAIEGDIAGFGEDFIVATPAFANVYRTTAVEEFEEEPSQNSRLEKY